MEQHQLLVSQLVADAVEDSSSDGAVSRIVNVLLESSTTDSERAGERLRVFGWEQEQHSSMIVWNYRVVGEASGDQYVDFSLTVEDGPDLLLSVFGLQLQIALEELLARTRNFTLAGPIVPTRCPEIGAREVPLRFEPA